jgi:hypothetical protein
MSLDRQLRDSPQIQFPLCAPTADAFRDFWPKRLAQAEPLLCQVIRVKGTVGSIGEIPHG